MLSAGGQVSFAAGEVTESYLQGLIPMAPEAITTLGADLFGDKVNLYNGALSFEQTDMSLPGNSKLPVALVRSTTPGRSDIIRGQFRDWDLEVPRLSGIFVYPGWVGSDGSANRCTYAGTPFYTSSGTGHRAWQGNSLTVPGAGRQDVLRRTAGYPAAPADGYSYPHVTHNNWQIRCLPSIQNASGEGFVAVSPDGVRYRLDWMASRETTSVGGSANEHFLFATEVTDRFGNWVRYTFDPGNPLLLTRIEANDGRVITVQNAGGRAVSASDGTRTFNYGYGGLYSDLTYAQQPDGSAWSFNLGGMRTPNLMIQGESANCSQPGDYDTTPLTGTVTHPSGAVGTFVHAFRAHGKTYVQQACKYTTSPSHTTGAVWPKLTMSHTLLSKSISGPGLPMLSWSYGYSGSNCWLSGAGVTGMVCNTHSDRKTITVTKPDGTVDRHIFGSRWRVNEGQLLELQEGWNGTSALRTTTHRYREPTGQAYPEQFGTTPLVTADWLASRHRPMDRKVVTQQGVTFTWELAANAAGLDALARPLQASMSSSLGYAKSETTQYSDHLGKWVMGQVASVTVSDGSVRSSTAYDGTTALPTAYSEFGRLLQTYAHHADGTLYRTFDPLGRATTWTNYVRGQAQNITYRDGEQESAVVNNLGKPTSHTNAAGTTTAYAYDAMGRLAQITPPAEPGMAYHTINSYFEQIPWPEYGIGAGHWRQTVIKGNARTVRYYDALWRVRLEHTYDIGTANTSRFVEYRYDFEGSKNFESYPQPGLAAVDGALPGRSWVFDGLDRETALHQSSELGTLTTTTQYLGNFQRRVTNPRGYATTFSYQVFDQPREDAIVGITSPESVWLSIARDIHGHALSITRGGTHAGNPQQLTRSYVYDTYKRLCKTIEPETGATVQAYDAAGNVAWRASGLSLPGGNCDQGSVPAARQVVFGYDARNRLTSTIYGDGSQSIGRSYTQDGLLKQIVASDPGNPITWTYLYNNRRLLAGEQYTWWSGATPGSGWNFSYAYDAHGNRSAMSDPWGSISYVPNALGQPTQVSGYASGITYHPNGAVAGYTLANGIAHSVSLNMRGLPELWQHAGVTRDRYSYDANGNVTGIADEQEGQHRSMPWYDGLDRLRQANGPWGGGHFEYDALDNLVSSNVGSRSLAHQYDGSNRLASLSGSLSLAIGYDANGNITSRGGQGYLFDIGNRMRQATGKASYVYDGHGRRNLVWYAGGDYKHQAYTQDGKLRFAWQQSSGHKRYVYLGDKLIAELGESGQTTFSHTDALGSPVARTSGGGALIERTRYEPYGATVAGSTNPTGIGFTGHVNDADTGLVYMQQRYYEPMAGRFLSVDPVVTDVKTGRSFNRYNYAANNPYRYVDPDGRDNKSVTFAQHEGTGQDGKSVVDLCPKCGSNVSQATDQGLGSLGSKSAMPLVAATSAIPVTAATVRAALSGSDLKTTQTAVSAPVVASYVGRLQAGEVAPPIKVDGKVIVDGNHRYVAARLLGQEPARAPGTASSSQVERAQPVQQLKVDPVDWGNR